MVAATPYIPEPPSPMSDDEWARLPEDAPGELVGHTLVEEEVPDCIHETAVAWLIQVLRAWGLAKGARVLGSELKYLLRSGQGRKPDVSLFLPGTPPPPARGPLKKPADVFIEVSSPSPRDVRRDRLDKLADYAAFGARWYWILDPAVRLLEIYELGADGRYTRALGADGGKVGPVPGCEGLELDLDQLWAEIDGLGKEEEPEG